MNEDPLLLKQELKQQNVHFTNNLLVDIQTIFANCNIKTNDSIFIITDSNVGKLYLKNIVNALTKLGYCNVVSFTLKSGEKTKSVKNFNNLVAKISQYNINKNSTIVGLGGGVVGDLAGFCASTLLRGIKFINIPTSLLAISDSSIGGKNGINLKDRKNSLGNFYNANAVIVNPAFLLTLNAKELQSGFFEIIKIALVVDKNFFNYLQNICIKSILKESNTLELILLKSIKHKLNIVNQDFLETKKLRYLLNYGHTYGHAFESYFKFGKIPHGFAVAMGMICANILSNNLGILSNSECNLVNNSIRQALKNTCFENKKFNVKKLYNLMLKDKKQSNNKVNIVALNAIGKGIFLEDITEHDIKQSLINGVDFIKWFFTYF